MNTFLLIDPTNHTLHRLETEDYKSAVLAVGLDPKELDHGIIARSKVTGNGLGIWVYEWGLMEPKTDHYFSFERQLYNGPAVVYSFDAEGNTTNISQGLLDHIKDYHLTWLDSAQEAEALIQAGKVNRPQTAINGEVVWEWTGEPKA